MSRLIQEIVGPFFDRQGFTCLCDPRRDSVALFPFALPPEAGIGTLVAVYAHDRDHDLRIAAELCQVPDQEQASILSVLNQLNLEDRWVKFYLTPTNAVFAEMDVELTYAADAEKAFGLAFMTFLSALHEDAPRILRAVSPSPVTRSRLEREVDELLQQYRAGSDEASA